MKLIPALLVCVHVSLAIIHHRPPPRPMWRLNSPSFKSALTTVCSSSKQDQMKRDACYGCFTRVSGSFQSNKSLEALRNCAAAYLQDTEFKACADILMESDYDERSGNSTVFCDFETCARRLDKQELVHECASEVAKQEGLSSIEVYLNTTTCILSKMRCQGNNGSPEMYYHGERYYALLVTDDKALRIVQVPYGQLLSQTCNNMPPYGGMSKVKQASWPSADNSSTACLT